MGTTVTRGPAEWAGDITVGPGKLQASPIEFVDTESFYAWKEGRNSARATSDPSPATTETESNPTGGREDQSAETRAATTEGAAAFSIGAKVSIAVGAAAGLCLILVVIIHWRKRRSRPDRLESARHKPVRSTATVRPGDPSETLEVSALTGPMTSTAKDTTRWVPGQTPTNSGLLAPATGSLPPETSTTTPDKPKTATRPLFAGSTNVAKETEKSVSSSRYDALPLLGDDIRILVIHKGHSSRLIECTLTIGSEESPYDALSYVWAQPVDPLPRGEELLGHVRLRFGPSQSPIDFDVGPNLELALRHLRQRHVDRPVWTDQICINQDEKSDERAQQVHRMDRFYGKATQVIAWLGGDSTGVSDLIEKARIATVRPSTFLIGHEIDMAKHQSREKFRSLIDENDLLTLIRIARLPFWSRRWILQEVTLAPDVVMQMGNYTFTWDNLLVLVELFDEQMFHPSDDYHVVVDNCQVDDEFTFANTVRRRIRPMQMLRWQLKERGAEFRLLDLVQALRNWDCGVPVDRVIALISLVHGPDRDLNTLSKSQRVISSAAHATASNHSLAERIKNAYRKILTDPKMDVIKEVCGMVEVYGRLFESHALTYNRLDGLNCHNGDKLPEFPSWIPNFHSKKRMYSLIEGVPHPGNWLSQHDPIFSASGNTSPAIVRKGSPSADTLEATGHLFDIVERTAEAFECPTSMPVNLAPSIVQEWAERVGPEIGSWEPGAYGINFAEAVRFTSVAGLTTQRTYLAGARASPMELYPSLPHPGQSILHHMSVVHERPVFRAVCGRRPFLTKKGYIGLGPAATSEGDYVCLLFGGQTPYLIRANGDGRWEFVGESYVHGIMDGEGIRDGSPRGQVFTFV